MTVPNAISQFAPNNNGERVDFTDKKDLENVPLVITGARTAKGKNGVFWIVECARQDTGEHIVFTGSTVIDQTMAAVKEGNGFPVAAMLVKVQPEEPGANWYWNLVDPPNTEIRATGMAQPPGRIAEIGAFVDRKVVTPEQVQQMCAEIAGAPGTKVASLSDDQYGVLLSILRELEAENERPLEPAPEVPF